jgi:hypothetical protein
VVGCAEAYARVQTQISQIIDCISKVIDNKYGSFANERQSRHLDGDPACISYTYKAS